MTHLVAVVFTRANLRGDSCNQITHRVSSQDHLDGVVDMRVLPRRADALASKEAVLVVRSADDRLKNDVADGQKAGADHRERVFYGLGPGTLIGAEWAADREKHSVRITSSIRTS